MAPPGSHYNPSKVGSGKQRAEEEQRLDAPRQECEDIGNGHRTDKKKPPGGEMGAGRDRRLKSHPKQPLSMVAAGYSKHNP